MNTQKILGIVVLVVGVLSVLLFGRIMGAGDEAIQGGEDGVVGPLMFLAYAVFAIAVALVVIFTLKNVASNPAALKSAGIGLGAFALLAGIAYAMSTGEPTPLKDGEMLTAGQARLVEAGIRLFFFLAIIAIGAMVLSGVKRMIK